MPGRWGEMPFAALILCLTGGIVAAQTLYPYFFWALALATSALTGASLIALRRGGQTPALSLALAAIVLCGSLLAIAHRDGFADSDLRALIARSEFPLGESVLFEGCVVEDARKRDNEMVATVEMRGFRKQDRWIVCRGGGLMRLPESAPEGAPKPDVKAGDRIRGWGTWRVPRNYQNPGSGDRVGYLERRGIFLYGRIKSMRLTEIVPKDCGNSWTRFVTGVRIRLHDNLDALDRNGEKKAAGVLASILLGDYSALDAGTREAFQNAGTYHVLVVSGTHVGCMAWALFQIFRLLRVQRTAGLLLVAAATFFYACIVGFQASITRCLWMFILCLAGRLCFRRASAANILLCAAFLLLAARPDWLFDVGFQLSFLSVAAMCFTALPLIARILLPLLESLRHTGDSSRLFMQRGRLERVGRRWRIRCELFAEAVADGRSAALQPLLWAICRGGASLGIAVGAMVLVSLSVQAWIEPLLAYHFNRLSWIAPLANLLVVPFSSAVLAAGILAATLSGVPVLGAVVIQFAAWISNHFLSLTLFFSMIPGAWQRCPTPSLLWILSGIVGVFLWNVAQWRQAWIPYIFIALTLAYLGIGMPQRELHGSGSWNFPPLLSLTFLDVGEGDSMIMRFPDDRTWVLDSGGIRRAFSPDEAVNSFDIGEAVISRYLWSLWIKKLDRLILSHPDQDHAGGSLALMKNFNIRRLDYGHRDPHPLMEKILNAAPVYGVVPHLLRYGERENVAGVSIRILHPPDNGQRLSTNEGSLVLYISFGRFSALLTGDLEKGAETELATRTSKIESLLLKVAHHGSRNSTSDLFLKRVRPRWAVISAGRNNPFGHPSPEAVFRLLRHGVRPLLTSDLGAITFATDGTRYVVHSHIGGILEQGTLPDP